MNKSVLISIRPRWIEKIARGEKTIEVRKTRPKLNPPFKCYIYCTRSTDHPAGWLGCYDHDHHKFGLISPLNIEAGKHMNIEVVSGMVVGEFICDHIYQYTTMAIKDGTDICDEDMERLSCLTHRELADYEASSMKGEGLWYFGLYGWHISDLKIYDKPKGLSSFTSPDIISAWEEYAACEERFGTLMDVVPPDQFHYRIKCPPRSWCYVV